MNGRSRKTVNIVILGLFLSLTLLVDFFHTETTLQERNDCPAGQYKKSSLSTAAVHLAPAVVRTFVSSVVPEADVQFQTDIDRDRPPRGPPVI